MISLKVAPDLRFPCNRRAVSPQAPAHARGERRRSGARTRHSPRAGRNRYAACQLAGIEPVFTTYDGDDPAGAALAVNIAHRHLTKGQQAVIAARALRVLKQNMRGGAKEYGISASRIAYASTVLDYTPRCRSCSWCSGPRPGTGSNRECLPTQRAPGNRGTSARIAASSSRAPSGFMPAVFPALPPLRGWR